MKPATFEYEAPESLEAALASLAERGDEAKVLAGGQSLVPMLALRLTRFEYLIDIGQLAELQGIGREDGYLGIGAATLLSVGGCNEEVASLVPLLRTVATLIGHPQIRNRGTVGGSVAHADPAAEYPAVALTLDAEMVVASTRGTRTIPAADFFESTWVTSMEPDEILTVVRFPVWTGRCGFAVEEVARRQGDFTLAGAVCAVQLDAAGKVLRCAIGLLGMGSTPLRAVAAEAAIVGTDPDPADLAELARLAVRETDPPTDLHASSAYRAAIGQEMVRRVLERAMEGARR